MYKANSVHHVTLRRLFIVVFVYTHDIELADDMNSHIMII